MSPPNTASGVILAGKKKLFVFGLGFSASRAALAFRAKGFEVAGTSRTQESAAQLAQQFPHVFHAGADTGERKRNVFVFDGTKWDPSNDVSVEQALAGVTHIIISVPTGRTDGQEDPVLYALREQLLAAVSGSLQWLAYLSTIGVYGETNGVAVDESAPVQSSVKRSQMRIIAEKQWLETGLPVHIFRIAGIYGPGRGTIMKVRSGTATRIHIPGRVFNRIHVDDIVNILLASAAKPNSCAIYNVCDDEPAPADQVTAYACELLNLPMVPSQTWEEAEATMSAMAKTFYAESKITKNDRIKNELGVKLIYPSYREGLLAQVMEEEANEEEAKHLLQTTFSLVGASTTQDTKKLVVLVNIGSLRPEPHLDLRQISFRLSRSLRLPVVPCSFRFSNRIDPSKLHGIAAKSFEMVLLEHLKQYKENTVEVVVLPLFFGNSSTLTEFLPEVLHKCWNKLVSEPSRPPLTLRLGGCLVDMANPTDNRIAKILEEKVHALTADVPQSEDVSVIVLDHGTPNREVHAARELVGDQLRELLANKVKLVGTACMERREGPEYDFNDPLLEVALDHYKIMSGVVIVAILFLSQGRHAGADGDIEETLAGVKQKHPNVDIRVTEPLGTHELLSEVLQDRYHQTIFKPSPEYMLTATNQ
ncbi:Nad-dependent epimerase/dehydratase, partial [Globisporangium splendens]